jgi:hypothetical protein
VRRRVDEILRRRARFPRAFSASGPWGLLLALLLAVVAALPLFLGPGLLNTRGGGDSPFLLQRVQQLSTALAAGHFPVRWMPDANYGYGYPFFHYYAPLSLYVAALFRFLGASYVLAIRFAQLAAFLLAAGTAYALGRRWFRSDAAGLLAAAAYTLAPFHLVNVYARGDSLAEFWAMAFYPLVLLAAERLLAAGGRARLPAAALGLSYAGLILSHNISALIFSPFLLLFLALRLWRHPNRRSALLGAAGALAWGLALAAWFWLPALAETGLAQTGPITAGYFHFANHFRGADLVQGSLLFSYDVSAGGAFRMGLLQAALIAAGLLSLGLAWRRAGDRISPLPRLYLVAGLLLATAMMTPLSRPLWEHLPLLSYTQFPWRFLSVQAFFGAMVAAALAHLPQQRWWLPALLVLLLVAALGGLRPSYLPLGDEDVTAERLAGYEWFSGNIGTTVSAEYLPQTVAPRPYSSAWLARGERDEAAFLQGYGTARLLQRQPTQQRWQVTAGAGGATLLLPVLHWPGWRATLDGAAWPLAPATGSGLITVEAPAGEHELLLSFGRTPLRAGAEIVSLAALAALLPAIWFSRVSLRAPLLAGAGGALLLAGAFAIWPAPRLDTGTLSWDFAQAAYLHHAPDGIPFAGEWRLRRYEYAAETVAPGASWTITLEWEGEWPPASAVTVALATPAANRFPAAPPLAVAEAPLRSGLQGITLVIPEDAPAGLYLPRLTIAGAPALMSNGEGRGDLYLRPLRVGESSEEAAAPVTPLAARTTSAALEGKAPAVTGDAPGLFDCASAGRPAAALRLSLGWYTAAPLEANLVASLRLADSAGRLLAQCDIQPGYGFQPSLAWRASRWTNDLLALPLPETLPAAAPYILAVHLYDGTGETRLTQRLGMLAWSGDTLVFAPSEPQFVLPEGLLPANAQFGDAAALRGYTAEQAGDTLAITLFWEALGAGRDSLVRFVQLLDAEGQIVQRPGASTVQVDSLPQGNSYPTSQWTRGEIVADSLRLALDGVAPGSYELAVGWYPPDAASNRLPVTLPDGAMPAERVVRLPVVVE